VKEGTINEARKAYLNEVGVVALEVWSRNSGYYYPEREIAKRVFQRFKELCE